MESQGKIEKILITLTTDQQEKLRDAFGLAPDTKCKYLGIKVTDEILNSILGGDDDGGTVVVYSAGGGGGNTCKI